MKNKLLLVVMVNVYDNAKWIEQTRIQCTDDNVLIRMNENM